MRINDLVEVSKNNNDILGEVIFWSAGGCQVDHKDLVDLAKAFGLEDRFLPGQIAGSDAFRKAVSSYKLEKNELLRKISDTKTEISYGYVTEIKDESAQKLTYSHELVITYDKGSEMIYSTPYQSGGIVDKLRIAYDEFKLHDTASIVRMVTSFCSIYGVMLRERGGVYFIPSPYRQQLDSLQKVFEGVSPENHLYRLPIFNNRDAQQELSGLSVATLDQEIKAIQQELTEFFSATTNSTRKINSMEKRLVEFDELRSRVKTFSSVLSFQSQDLIDQLDQAQRQLASYFDVGYSGLPDRPPVKPAITDTPPVSTLPSPPVYSSEVGF